MVRLWAALGSARFTEDWIDDTTHFVDGYTEGRGHIWINPAPAMADTIIHELLHTMQPAWSEAYVRRTTTYLLRRMTDAEIRQFYEEYLTRRKRRTRRKKVDG